MPSTAPPRSHASTALPTIVEHAVWEAARAELLTAEKAHTRAGDALAAQRRRLPMVRIDGDWQLTGPEGPVRLLDLFEGRRQLVLYHHMLERDDPSPCAGCTTWSNGIGRLEHAHVRDLSFALISVAPHDQVAAYTERFGIDAPFYSSHGTSFEADINPSPHGAGSFAVSVFLREGNHVYRTYATHGRGAEQLVFGAAVLDIAPYGRQESFEDSPVGWPQVPTYTIGGLPDEYTAQQLSGDTAPSSTGAKAPDDGSDGSELAG